MDSVIHAGRRGFRIGIKLGQGERSGVLRLVESLPELLKGFDFGLQVLEVAEVGRPGFGMRFEILDLFNKGAEVMQGAHGRERRIIRITIQTSNSAKNECVLNDVERNAALIESGGQ